jgi:hypothetical protein
LTVPGSAIILLVAALSVAPFQCPSSPDPEKRREETPGEALHDLAKEFGKAGDREAQIRTLKYLIEKYPRSRHAVEAHQELEAMGVSSPDPRDLADPAGADPAGADPAGATSAAPSAP